MRVVILAQPESPYWPLLLFLPLSVLACHSERSEESPHLQLSVLLFVIPERIRDPRRAVFARWGGAAEGKRLTYTAAPNHA
jgi:hypothetical protein